MTENAVTQTILFLGVLLLLVKPLGGYMAAVYEGRLGWGKERWVYRLAGIDPEHSMSWREYSVAFLLFNALGALVVYALLRFQHLLPLNPQSFPAVDAHTAFNIAVSFASNTNWQNYSGEGTLSYLTQMAGLTVQNFASAASGMAVLAALARGLVSRNKQTIGNFWVDAVRGSVYILLPLAVLVTVILMSQGVIENLDAYKAVTDGGSVLPMGPAASQIAIKQLGTNGGGFFNANSAHPFENPTPLSNFVQLLAIVLIPAAFCYTFGVMVNARKQGWALLGAMLLLFVPLLLVTISAEAGNMEGKEVRFGTATSAMWATATTAASNGSVNSMHDSFSPIGGFALLFLMQLGEVVFGGVGSGLYGMIIFAIVTVFIAGLMVGRTPEYLGKKIEPFEMKMASLAILVPPVCVLLGTALAVATPMGISGLQDHGPHGFTEILYAFTSMGNNNGSAFAGYSANNPLVNFAGGIAMLFARYWVAIPVLAIAGSVAQKKTVPVGPGTLRTDNLLFVGLLGVTVIIVGALAFIPALALGPVVEALR